MRVDHVARRAASVALTIAALFFAPRLCAQDKVQAEALFQEANALVDKGEYQKACPKLADSMRLDPSAGTQINLGLCYEKMGKTASAWAEFKAAAELARRQNRPAQQTKAANLAARLEPKLSKLRIDGPGAEIPGLVVKRDGIDVGVSSLGSSAPIDPGEHTITVVAPGYREWSTKVVVGTDGDSKTVAIPALEKVTEPAANAPLTTPAPVESAPVARTSGAPPTAPRSSGALRTAGFVIGGIGAAGLVVGGVFGLLAIGDKSDALADDNCPDYHCQSQAGRDLVSSGETKALVATLSIGIGAGLLATGVVLVIVGKPSRSEASGSRRVLALSPTTPRGGAGASIAGAF